MISVFLSDGFEEIEALAPVDFLRRAGVEVQTVALSGNSATGSHKISVKCDISLSEFKTDESFSGVILPGGMPGAEHLYDSSAVKDAVRYAADNGLLVAAICAAPVIPGKMGLLSEKNATCFPGFEKDLYGAVISDEAVVTDGNFITARGAGVSWEFAAAIISKIQGADKAKALLGKIQWKK